MVYALNVWKNYIPIRTLKTEHFRNYCIPVIDILNTIDYILQ